MTAVVSDVRVTEIKIQNKKGVKLDKILRIMNQDFRKISKIDKMAKFEKKFRIFLQKRRVFCIANLQFLTNQKDPCSWYLKTCAEYTLKIPN